MEKNNSNANGGIGRKIRNLFASLLLRRLAGALCQATQRSERASDEILYALPGVFSMEITAPCARITLIKEAGRLRIQDRSEKSDVLLTLCFHDLASVGDVVGRECTFQKALAEGRMSFCGKTKHLNAIMRASAFGDGEILSAEEYRYLYGKDREE